MIELTTVSSWRQHARSAREGGASVGLVATMGALHRGHESLFASARETCDVVLATLFVNPRQFGDDADLARYPRTLEVDREIARRAGVDCLVVPSLEEMWPDYPRCTPTTVSVRGVSDSFEGVGRPGHFDGVASVVAKLIAISEPTHAFFGEKDYQQLCVVRQLTRDLGFEAKVVGCPIVRDDDGLALSSRNVRLSDEGRHRALGLSHALSEVSQMNAPASALRARMRAVLESSGVEVDYADVVDPHTLVPSRDDEAGVRRALVAGDVEGVRLLDNGPVAVVKN